MTDLERRMRELYSCVPYFGTEKFQKSNIPVHSGISKRR
jgi:hypothetical protein